MTSSAVLHISAAFGGTRLCSVLCQSVPCSLVPAGSYLLESKVSFSYTLLLFVRNCFLPASTNQIHVLQQSLYTAVVFNFQPASTSSSIWQCLEVFLGEGNGTPLPYSCLENPMGGGAWQAAVHGVTKSRTRLSDFTFTFTFMHWRRKWQPTPIFLPGEPQGWGSLVGCHLWGRTESDTTEATQQQQQNNITNNPHDCYKKRIVRAYTCFIWSLIHKVTSE